MARLVAIKVGGGLAAEEGRFAATCETIAWAARSAPIVVLPGGGPFADAVRAFDARHRLSAPAAHWMAILGMDQYAHALADRIAGASLVDAPADVRPALAAGRVPVLAPYRWLRAADPFEPGWDTTSDSLAAWMAGVLGATRLVLVKPVEGKAEDLVDRRFAHSRPADLEVTAVAAGDGEALIRAVAG